MHKLSNYSGTGISYRRYARVKLSDYSGVVISRTRNKNRAGINGSPPVRWLKKRRLSRRSYVLSCLHVGYLMITRAMRRIIILPSEHVLGPASWMILITHDRENSRRMDCFRLVSGMKRLRTGSLMTGFMCAGRAAPGATIRGKKKNKKRRPTIEPWLMTSYTTGIDFPLEPSRVSFPAFPTSFTRGVIS